MLTCLCVPSPATKNDTACALLWSEGGLMNFNRHLLLPHNYQSQYGADLAPPWEPPFFGAGGGGRSSPAGFAGGLMTSVPGIRAGFTGRGGAMICPKNAAELGTCGGVGKCDDAGLLMLMLGIAGGGGGMGGDGRSPGTSSAVRSAAGGLGAGGTGGGGGYEGGARAGSVRAKAAAGIVGGAGVGASLGCDGAVAGCSAGVSGEIGVVASVATGTAMATVLGTGAALVGRGASRSGIATSSDAMAAGSPPARNAAVQSWHKTPLGMLCSQPQLTSKLNHTHVDKSMTTSPRKCINR